MIRREAIASVVKLAVVVLLGFAVSACEWWSSEPGVKQARALSAEELTEIFRGMEELQRRLPVGGAQIVGNDPGLPARIRALDALVVDVGDRSRIVLSASVDSKVMLVFDGLGRPGPKRIRLTAGDAPDEVLWEEAAPEPVAQ